MFAVARGPDLRGESFGHGSDASVELSTRYDHCCHAPIRMLQQNPAVMSYGMTCQ